VQLVDIGVELVVLDHVDHLALLDDIVPIGHRRREAEVLLDQDNRVALLLELADGRADLVDDHRGQALRRLVEQQEMCAGAQDAPDRQHLLLAARELGALALQALLDVGEEREDLVEREARRAARCGGSIRFSSTLSEE
jgi:hypothetical protein